MTARQLLSAVTGLLLALMSLCAIATDLDTARSYQTQGDQLFEAGKNLEAISAYNQALFLYERLAFPQHAAVVRHQIGAAYWRQGDLAQALVQFEANLSYHEGRDDRESMTNYLFYTGQLYLLTGQLESAERNLSQASGLLAAIPQRFAEVEHWRVILSEKQGKPEQAKAILTAARLLVDDESWNRHLAADAARLNVSAATTREMQSNQRAFAFVAALALLAALGIAVKLGFAGERTKNVLLTVFSLGIAVALAEAALRFFTADPPSIQHLLHTPNQVTQFSPSAQILIGVDTPQTHFSVNNDGLRGDPVPKDASTFRILAIGGSSTEALFLDDGDAWPYVLQGLLRDVLPLPVWIGNAGKSGLNSFSHATQFYFYKDELRPHLVILQAGINDLNQCVSGGLGAIRDNARLIRQPGFFEDYQRYVFQEMRPAAERPSWRIGELYQKARASLEGSRNDSPQNSPFDFVVQDQAATFYVEQRARRDKARKIDRAPHIDECLAAFRYNIDLIADMASHSGIQLVLLTQGSLYRSNLSPEEEKLLWFGSLDVNPFAATPALEYYAAPVLDQLLSEYNDQTLGVCAAGKAQCLDVDRILPKTTATYYDDVHLNIGGSRALAAALADFLLRRNLVPKD